jgi:hypothetical protein
VYLNHFPYGRVSAWPVSGDLSLQDIDIIVVRQIYSLSFSLFSHLVLKVSLNFCSCMLVQTLQMEVSESLNIYLFY